MTSADPGLLVELTDHQRHKPPVPLSVLICVSRYGSTFEDYLSNVPFKLLSGVSRYSANARQYFDDYLPGPKRTVFHTKKGLSWRNAWGVLRYSANNAFIAFVLADQMQTQASSAIMMCVHEEDSMRGTL